MATDFRTLPCVSSWIASLSLGRADRVVEFQRLAVPRADAGKHDHADQRDDGEPGDASLPVGQHDEGREQRTERRAEIAADLEHRLGEAVLAAGREPGHARGLWVKHRRSHADQSDGDQHQAIGRGKSGDDQAEQRTAHAEHERIGRGVTVGDEAHQRLEQRCGEGEGEGDEADLAEVERKALLDHGVERHDQRLNHVVQHVTDADGGEHRDRGALRGRRGRSASCLDRHSAELRA